MATHGHEPRACAAPGRFKFPRGFALNRGAVADGQRRWLHANLKIVAVAPVGRTSPWPYSLDGASKR